MLLVIVEGIALVIAVVAYATGRRGVNSLLQCVPGGSRKEGRSLKGVLGLRRGEVVPR